MVLILLMLISMMLVETRVLAGQDQADLPNVTEAEVVFASPGGVLAKSEFPTVRGKNLNGREFFLPNEFEGALNLVFIAFQRKQQAMVNTWLPYAQSIRTKYPGIRYYELPTISQLNPLFRWYIDRGMRSGITDSTARATTITLYLDKPEFRKALDMPDEGTIYILLMDDEGKILWRTNGVKSQETQIDLENTIIRYTASKNRFTKIPYLCNFMRLNHEKSV